MYQSSNTMHLKDHQHQLEYTNPKEERHWEHSGSLTSCSTSSSSSSHICELNVLFVVLTWTFFLLHVKSIFFFCPMCFFCLAVAVLERRRICSRGESFEYSCCLPTSRLLSYFILSDWGCHSLVFSQLHLIKGSTYFSCLWVCRYEIYLNFAIHYV